MSNRPHAVTPGFRIVRHTKRLDLEGDFAGGWVEVTLNPPAPVLETATAVGAALAAHSPEHPWYPTPALREAVAGFVRSWNFQDEQGKPLPPDATGVAQLDSDLLLMLLGAWLTARALPKPTASASATTSAA